MELNPLQQTIELLEKNQKILIVAPEELKNKGASWSNALALALALKKINKTIDLIKPAKLPKYLNFLPPAKEINLIDHLYHESLLEINLSKNDITSLNYQYNKYLLKIFIGTHQPLQKKDVTISNQYKKYDLIITVNCSDLEQLGSIYQKNAPLFFETTILNIDHQAANEYFGQVNLVNINCASTAEIINEIIETYTPEIIDQDIALCLLTGLILDTNNFCNPQTTPRTFSLASSLTNKNIDHYQIISHIFQNKSLRLLKLLGKSLSKIKKEVETNLFWIYFSENESKKNLLTPKKVKSVLEQLENYISDKQTLAYIWQQENQTFGILRLNKSQKENNNIKEKLYSAFEGKMKGDYFNFIAKKTIFNQPQEIIKRLKEVLK